MTGQELFTRAVRGYLEIGLMLAVLDAICRVANRPERPSGARLLRLALAVSWAALTWPAVTWRTYVLLREGRS